MTQLHKPSLVLPAPLTRFAIPCFVDEAMIVCDSSEGAAINQNMHAGTRVIHDWEALYWLVMCACGSWIMRLEFSMSRDTIRWKEMDCVWSLHTPFDSVSRWVVREAFVLVSQCYFWQPQRWRKWTWRKRWWCYCRRLMEMMVISSSIGFGFHPHLRDKETHFQTTRFRPVFLYAMKISE